MSLYKSILCTKGMTLHLILLRSPGPMHPCTSPKGKHTTIGKLLIFKDCCTSWNYCGSLAVLARFKEAKQNSICKSNKAEFSLKRIFNEDPKIPWNSYCGNVFKVVPEEHSMVNAWCVWRWEQSSDLVNSLGQCLDDSENPTCLNILLHVIRLSYLQFFNSLRICLWMTLIFGVASPIHSECHFPWL